MTWATEAPNGSRRFRGFEGFVHVDDNWSHLSKGRQRPYRTGALRRRGTGHPQGPKQTPRHFTKVVFLASAARFRWNPAKRSNFNGETASSASGLSAEMVSSSARYAGPVSPGSLERGPRRWQKLVHEEAFRRRYSCDEGDDRLLEPGTHISIYTQQDHVCPHCVKEDEELQEERSSDEFDIFDTFDMDIIDRPPSTHDTNILDNFFLLASIQSLGPPHFSQGHRRPQQRGGTGVGRGRAELQAGQGLYYPSKLHRAGPGVCGVKYLQGALSGQGFRWPVRGCRSPGDYRAPGASVTGGKGSWRLVGRRRRDRAGRLAVWLAWGAAVIQCNVMLPLRGCSVTAVNSCEVTVIQLYCYCCTATAALLLHYWCQVFVCLHGVALVQQWTVVRLWWSCVGLQDTAVRYISLSNHSHIFLECMHWLYELPVQVDPLKTPSKRKRWYPGIPWSPTCLLHILLNYIPNRCVKPPPNAKCLQRVS